MTDLFQYSVTVDPFLPFSYPDSLGPSHLKCCFIYLVFRNRPWFWRSENIEKVYDLAIIAWFYIHSTILFPSLTCNPPVRPTENW